MRDAVEQAPRRVGLAREEALVEHRHLQHGDLQAPDEGLDRIRDLGVVEDEVEQHGDDVDGDRIELADALRNAVRLDLVQDVHRANRLPQVGQALDAALLLHQRVEALHFGEGVDEDRLPGVRRLGARGNGSQPLRDGAFPLRTDGGMHQLVQEGEQVAAGRLAALGLRGRRRRRLIPLRRAGRRGRGDGLAVGGAQAGQDVPAHHLGVEVGIHRLQGLRDVLLDLLEQHQLQLHAALELVAGALQRIADGLRADRVFLVLQLLLAEQHGDALAEERQLALVLLAQPRRQVLQGDALGEIVLLDQAQLLRRCGQRLHCAIHLAAHLVVEDIDEMAGEGGLDLRPAGLGLAAHLEIEVLHLAVVARLGHPEQLFLDVVQHPAQGAGQALHGQFAAIVEHAARFRHAQLAPLVQVNDIAQCTRSHTRLHSQPDRALARRTAFRPMPKRQRQAGEPHRRRGADR